MKPFFVTNGHILVLVIVLVCLAIYSDLRWRKIPNCLTLPAIALGFVLNFVGNSWNGLIFAFFGLLLGMGLLMLPYLLGGMGGGDVKLMGALGALLGSHAVLNVFLYTSLVGGMIAIAVAVANRSLIEMLKRIVLFLKCVFLFQAPATGAAVFKKSPSMPYGVAMGAGTLLYLIAGKIV
ncbi:MAG: prepilin peptidase [Candidatus Zixiibacteriota bacterium]